MKPGELPGWAIAIALLLIAIVFVYTALFAREPFYVADLQFGPVLEADLTLTDAVIAFDRSRNDKCPDGWKHFVPAASRMIIGAGPIESKGPSGEALTIYEAFKDQPEKARGGKEQVTLGPEHMPKHNHKSGDFDSIMVFDGTNQAPSDITYNNLDDGRVNLRRRGVLADAGRDNPDSISLMPPYIALYFCKKES